MIPLLIDRADGYALALMIIVFVILIMPLFLYIIGLFQYKKNKKRGKVIFIIASLYAIISFGFLN